MDITRWAELVRIEECSVLGVARAGQPTYTCKRVYTPDDRAMIQDALDAAQDDIERQLGYPLGFRAVCDEERRWGENGIISPLDWGHVRSFGQVEYTTISAAYALTLGLEANPNDPVTITVAWPYDECELVIQHVSALGGDRILPSSITITAGVATVLVPRCRLVNPTIVQPATGYNYNLNANFVTTVDVIRRHVNPSLGAELVWFPVPPVSVFDCDEMCEETTQSACAVIRRRRINTVQVWPASYTGESASPASFSVCSRYPDVVRLSYVANYSESCPELCEESPRMLEMAVIRYAHTLLPHPPCACSAHEFTWTDDRKPLTSPVVKAIDNPFGWLQGQIFAWNTITKYKQGRGGLF